MGWQFTNMDNSLDEPVFTITINKYGWEIKRHEVKGLFPEEQRLNDKPLLIAMLQDITKSVKKWDTPL